MTAMFYQLQLKIIHLPVLMALASSTQLAIAEEKKVNASADSSSLAELPQVNVQSTTTTPSYQPLTTKTAAKIEAPLRDIPQTVNVITQAIIQDQGAQSLQDALRNVPGIGFSNGDGQRDQVNIRGFSAISDQFVDGFRDDALYFRDLSNVEEIEVLKGPAAVLYGRGSSGGIINRITKKPLDKAIGSLTATVGSYDFYRVEADVNQPLGDAAAFRIIGAKQDSHGFREEDFVKREFIAPSLSLNLSDATKLTFQLEHLDDKRLNDFGVPAINGRPVSVSRKTYYGSSNGEKDDYVQSRMTAGTAVLEHGFNDDVKIRNAFRAYEYDLDRNNTVAVRVLPSANSQVTRRYSTVQRQEDGYFNQTDLTIKAKGLGLDHSLLFGVEIGRQIKDNQNGNFANPGNVSLYDPVLPRSQRTGFAATADTSGISETKGFYAQDLVTLSKNWKALIGARYDIFDQEAKNRLNNTKLSRVDKEISPRAGLVYQPNDFVSLYGSYTKSFQPSQENFTLAANNAEIAPEETTNYEVGAKMDFLDGNLSTMISLFRLERTNIKSADPAAPTVLLPVGEQRTDGLELSAAGKLADGWDVTAGYAYMDAEITDSPSTVTSVFGPTATAKKFAIEGNRPSLTPRHSANVWLSHRLGNGFGLGGGAVFVGDQYASVSNEVKLPGYVRFDASAYYETKHYDVKLTLNNIFDREYFISAHGGADLYNTYGSPRSALLSLKLKY
ncbi:MAG: TonB-dependent siderophore receptor [Methylotenera sp.]|uniref:TonB-dependent receptor n=1 Tax=Methylotenera sp. TaxID=2051956 RepID=UPI002489C7D4|nr:TonB-dependent siderophore receptor [Methylotenera sp.]MDI1308868.1 TonB-dependent siderophore receptor [Methylotenera sp.]